MITSVTVTSASQSLTYSLRRNENHQLHLPVRKQGIVKPVFSKRPLGHLMADLTDWSKYMGHNKQRKYILSVIDVFSRYLWAVPVLSTQSHHVVDGFQKVFQMLPSDHKPGVLSSDNGPEFANKDMKRFATEHNFKHIFSLSHNPQSQGIIERTQRTLANKIKKHMSLTGDKNYTDYLQDIVDGYNNTVHSSTQRKPHDMMFGIGDAPEEGHKQDIETREETKQEQQMFVPLGVGDWVRISLVRIDKDERRKHKQNIRKAGSDINWSKDKYKVTQTKNMFF